MNITLPEPPHFTVTSQPSPFCHLFSKKTAGIRIRLGCRITQTKSLLILTEESSSIFSFGRFFYSAYLATRTIWLIF